MTLTCSDCQHRIGAQPKLIDDEIRLHLGACDACRQFYEQTQKLDSTLFKALQSEAFAQQIAPLSVRKYRQQWLSFSVAAAVIFIGLAVILLWPQQYDDTDLTQAIVTHLAMEPDATSKAKGAADDTVVSQILSAANMTMDAQKETAINYIMRCLFDGEYIVHMVIEGSSGPVTVLWLSEKHHQDHSIRFHGENFQGLVTPITHGAVAVISSFGDIDAETDRILDVFHLSKE